MNSRAVRKRLRSPASATIVIAVRCPTPTPQGLQGPNQSNMSAASAGITKSRVESFHAIVSRTGDGAVVLKHHLVGGVVELQLPQPGLPFRGPRADTRRRRLTLYQEELGQAMMCTELVHLGVGTCTDEAPKALMLLVRHPHRPQVARSEKPSELEAVAPVGLDAIARSHRHERGSDDGAVDPECAQLPMQTYPMGPASYAATGRTFGPPRR